LSANSINPNTRKIKIPIHQVRSPERWKTTRVMIASARKMPCLSDTLTIFPASQLWVGRSRQRERKRRALPVLTARKRLRKKAGIACPGAVSGLTLKRMMRREVIERREAMERPKRREVMTRIRARARG
jgi:hypothetical protein